MSKVWFFILLSLGLIIKPSDVFGQYLNKAIFFDSVSAELPYGLIKFNSVNTILGSTLDSSNNSYPFLLLENDSFKKHQTFFYKSGCSVFHPARTNSLGSQGGNKYFIANCNPSFNKFLMYKILIDSLGDTVKTYRMNNSDTNLALRTHFLPNGDMLVLGQEAREYFLQKWRGDSLLWNYTSDLNGPTILQRILIDENNILVGGRIGILNNDPGSDLFFAKFSQNGKLLWSLRKDLGESEGLGGITKHKNKYVFSFTKAPWINWTNFDLVTYLGVIDTSGSWITHMQIGNEGRSRISNFLINTGEYLLYNTGEHNIDYNKRESVFYRLNDDFEIQWERRYLYEAADKHSSNVWDIKIEPDSSIKTIGVLYNGPGGQDLWYLHLDKHGCLTQGCEANDVTVEEINPNGDLGFSMYPNPTQNQLQVSLYQKATALKLFNLQGQLVLNQPIPKGSMQLSIQLDLPKGLYLVQLLNHGKIVGQEKLVVE